MWCHAPRRAARSEPEVARARWIDGVVVESLAALPPVHARQDHALEQRRGSITPLAILGEHDLRDLVCRVQPDEVEKRERTHWMAGPELHPLVDIVDRRDPV